MAVTHYTARVQKNGSLSLPKEAQEALNLQPGDEIEFQVEVNAMELEQDELRHAVDVGIEQLERAEYTIYTQDTLHELVDEVKSQGRKRLVQHIKQRAS